tara:strand:+ start:270 stop:2177 length:1908 start_codon:yes stop_codon:yes gene_type:complete
MAKGGTNLNPGADATLVAAATRAAMANVPKDLSGTFEAMSKSYADTMKTIGQVYGEAAKTLGKIGGSLVKEAIKNQSNITAGDPHVLETEIEIQGPQTEENAGAPGGLITTDTSDDPKPREKTTKKTTIGDELRGIRSELFSLSLKTDKKSRMRKNELRAERAQFTSDIAFLDNARKVTDGQLKSGNVNFETTGKLNLAFKQGMNALTTKTGVIADGEFKGYKLVPTRDENGQMAFMMRDNLGNFVTGQDESGNPTTKGEKPHVIPASETSTLLEMKMDQKMLDPVQKKITGQFKAGQTGLPYLGNQLVNSMRPVLDNEATLRQLSDVRFGDDEKTLRDHVNSASEYSAKMFSEISSADLASMGVDEMADGKKGITRQDFIGSDVAVINFNKVKSATFDKTNPNYDSGSHLKALTESHIYRTGEIMHGAGAKLYVAPKTNNNNSNSTSGGSNSLSWGNTYKPYSEQDTKVADALAGKDLYDWENNKYTTKDGGATYSPVEANSLYSAGQNIATNDLLGGGQFGLSHRIGNNKFGGGSSSSSSSSGGGGENPFGETQANRAPADFVTAVGKDDIDVVAYLEGMGVTVTNKLGDKVEVEINGKTKTFTVDPNIATDENRANEMWKWMFENWTKKKLK